MNSCCKVCCFLPLQNWKDRGFWKESSEGSQRNLRIHGSRHLESQGVNKSRANYRIVGSLRNILPPLKTNMTLDNSHVQRENTSSDGGRGHGYFQYPTHATCNHPHPCPRARRKRHIRLRNSARSFVLGPKSLVFVVDWCLVSQKKV